MSDDEVYKTRDPRLKKRENRPDEDFPPPPGTSDIFPPGEDMPASSSSTRRKKSRSRSRSPEGRSRRRHYDSGDRNSSENNRVDDAWKKTTDAFLQNLGASPGIASQIPGYPPPGYPQQGYAMPYAAYGQHPGYATAQMPYAMHGMSGVDDQNGGSSRNHRRNRTPPKDMERRQHISRSPDEESTKRKRKTSTGSGGITREQYEKLKAQKQQYHEAKQKLEAQLLKLKEQREALKEDGAVHEDLIMKENAKLQKEVKSRIQYIVDVLGKMDTALEQPVIVEKSRTRSPSPKETRRVRKTSTDSENDSSRRKSFKQRKISPSTERSEEIHRRSKSKKKQKDSSSSDEESDRSKKKKKRKRHQKKSSSESSSSSDSSDEKDLSKFQLDESVIKMVADLQKGGKSSKKPDNMLMELLSKMSEAYMSAKKENGDYQQQIEHLQIENKLLKAQVEKLLREKEEKKKENDVLMDTVLTSMTKSTKKFENTKHIVKDDIEEPEPIKNKKVKMEQKIQPPVEPVPAPVPKEDQHRSIRARMIEAEMAKPRGFRRGDSSSSSSSSSSSRSRSRSRTRVRRHSTRSRSGSASKTHNTRRSSGSGSRSKRSRSRSRSRSLSKRSRSNRSRSWSRSRSKRSRSKSEVSRDREKRGGEKRKKEETEKEKEKEIEIDEGKDMDDSSSINLDEWKPKKAEPVKVDPTLASIKEKLKQKQEAEATKQKIEEENRKRQQWTTATMAPVDSQVKPDANLQKEFTDKEKLDPVRPQVAIQWGLKGLKGKTPEPQSSMKKAMPFVGKMPRKKDNSSRDSNSPAKSKFGPLSGSVPPPGVCTTASPTPPTASPLKPQPPPPTTPTFTMATTPPIPVAQLGGKRAPKNPTPKNVDLQDMLAAAKAHMSARGEGFQERSAAKMTMEIPLPPLPAAQDRDPDAMKDTRPPKIPTPPLVQDKSELQIMLEMHANNIPPELAKDRDNDVVKPRQVEQPPPPATVPQQHPNRPAIPHQGPPPKPAYDMTMYATYAAHWGPGFDPRALRESCADMPPMPINVPPGLRPGLIHGPPLGPHGPVGPPLGPHGPVGPLHGPPGPVHRPPIGPVQPVASLPSRGGSSETELPNPEATLAALAEAVPSIGFSSRMEKMGENEAVTADKVDDETTNDVDPEELALLGIDPADFAGFGK